MTLWSDFQTNDQHIIHKWKHYFPAYERHFAKFVNTDVVFLEIGCGQGGSLQMWKRFLGPYARIVGIDLRPECKEFAEDQIDIRIGDQSDKTFLLGVCKEFGVPDVVLDDGSHVMSHIHASFSALYPQLPRNGVYMVEDLHTAYWSEFEGGLERKESFMETCKHLIDELNADHSRGALPATEFSRTTLSIHFYDSIVVFEKGRHGTKIAPQIGQPPRKSRWRIR
jgi:hypothetical protein